MFDDAEKKIARLMAESTTSGESKSGSSKVKVRGHGNVVALGDINVTVHINGMSHLSVQNEHAEALTEVPKSLVAVQRAAILRKCLEIGDPDLYRPFIKAAYGASQLEDLGPADLGRLEWWLGIRGTRP